MQQASNVTTTMVPVGALPPAPANLTRLQLPDMPASYYQYDGDQLGRTLPGGISPSTLLNFLFRGNPQFSNITDLIGAAGQCAQQNGIFNMRFYFRQGDWTAAGVAVVVSRNEMTNLDVIGQCVPGVGGGGPGGGISFSPCWKYFAYYANNDTYYGLYAASQEYVCQDFRVAFNQKGANIP